MGKQRRRRDVLDESAPLTSYNFKHFEPRGEHQKQYLKAIASSDVTFGIGAAGGGKTFLAVSAALEALKNKEVSRIIITRPVVEAGEKLGFLPGDLQEKINPYLRPIYDSFFTLIGPERLNDWRRDEIVEIAPLAYMRGRSLTDAFIIVDEAQNTTIEQMRMVLTRIGSNSKMVVTGDTSQSDLGTKVRSGLLDAICVLEGTSGISFVYFDETDVQRHPIVKSILRAYDKSSQQKGVGGFKKDEKV